MSLDFNDYNDRKLDCLPWHWFIDSYMHESVQCYVAVSFMLSSGLISLWFALVSKNSFSRQILP